MPIDGSPRYRPATSGADPGPISVAGKRPLRYRPGSVRERSVGLGAMSSFAQVRRRELRHMQAARWERVVWVVGLVIVTLVLWLVVVMLLTSVLG
jgi:hypothetical protein